MDSPILQIVPNDATDLEYLAEGAANVVYRPSLSLKQRLTLSGNFGENYQVSDPLLRLRKDVPHLSSVASQSERFVATFAPLFHPTQLIPQRLIRVPTSLIEALNARLEHDERLRQRPPKRTGGRLAVHETHGLLVQDMTAASSEILFEIKPKWLVQSPNAPKESIRCRTCALRAMRTAKSSTLDIVPRDARGLCPLKLVAHDARALDEATQSVLGGRETELEGKGRDGLRKYLATTPVLSNLGRLQRHLDPAGILGLCEGSGTTGVPQSFLIATTLRDCTLYVRLHVGSGVAEGRLGDLDLKMPEPGKVAYWRDTELHLQSGGWYTAKPELVTGCLLEPKGLVTGE